MFRVLSLWFLTFFLFSCGIDSDPSLGEEVLNISVSLNTSARISPLSYDDDTQQYLVYYKIYISGANETGTITRDLMNSINPSLLSDFNAILPYTPDSSGTRPLPVFSLNVFSSRGFYSLYLNNSDTIKGPVLLSIDFTGIPITDDAIDGTKPYAEFDNGEKFLLRRSNGGGSFSPLPEDRYFVNTEDLNKAENLSTSVNADVKEPDPKDEPQRYAYCAVYIVKQGLNPNSLAPIYGNPNFITVFRLPEM